MTLSVGFSLPVNLGGLICTNGWMFPTVKIENISEEKKFIPIFAIHGKDDDTIPISVSEVDYEKLWVAGFNIEFHSEEDTGHRLT